MTDPFTPPARNAPWATARDLARGLGRRLGTESIDIDAADRRVMAAPVHALTDLPSFDASAMDGWAVRGAEPWTVVGTVHAGDPRSSELTDGTAVRIATGAPVPLGTDGVLRSERGRLIGALLSGPASPDEIRRAGEECRAGDLLADAGTELSPSLLGLLAASGHDRVRVTMRPRIHLLVLGDELVASGVPRAGFIRDALGPQIPAWLVRAGGRVVATIHVSDSLDALRDALTEADGDIIITTGGTAAGPRDHLREAISAARGSLVVDEVAVRPGHPMLLATVGGRPLVALPGNPQAAVVSLLTLALPLIDAQLGRSSPTMPLARLAEDVSGLPDRQRLVAGLIELDGFHPAPHTGPAMMRGLAASSGYAVIPYGGATAGSWVDWLVLP